MTIQVKVNFPELPKIDHGSDVITSIDFTLGSNYDSIQCFDDTINISCDAILHQRVAFVLIICVFYIFKITLCKKNNPTYKFIPADKPPYMDMPFEMTSVNISTFFKAAPKRVIYKEPEVLDERRFE